MGFEGFLYRCPFAGLQSAQVFDGLGSQEYLEPHSGQIIARILVIG
jgi:hypothetical protein